MIDAHCTGSHQVAPGRTGLRARARLPGRLPDVLVAALAVGVLLVVSGYTRDLPGGPLGALGYALLVAAGSSRWPGSAP